MLRINQLKLPITHTEENLIQKVQKILHCSEIPGITIIRRSVDARKKPDLYFNYILNVSVKNQRDIYKRCDKKQVVIHEEKKYCFPVKHYSGEIRPVIVGMGPAGLFSGYMLAQAGFRPIILEQGKCVEERTVDVQHFWEAGELNPFSNVQFGEGGAGTFSDGKLNTLVKDTFGRNRKVLSLFVECGAPKEILYDHMPHIGTDALCGIITNMRRKIIAFGGEVRFNAKVTGIETENERVTGVIINQKERLKTNYVILAPGHSARDLFTVLDRMKIKMEAKPFAIGVRVEHPQELINQSQYGQKENEILGNAPYKLTAQSRNGRGVYSFCMCPGGYVVNASSEPGRLAVNGMSYSGRNSRNANSAIIVTVTPQDYGGEAALAGVEFQRQLEEKAFGICKGKIPVERYGDICVNGADAFSAEKNENTNKGKLHCFEHFTPCIKGQWDYGPVHEILPESVKEAFIDGMEQFGRVIPGFNHPKVLIEGLESRTSSPVRIVRSEDLQSSLTGLYPCGEGAGYAGGITSAAMDGIKVAEVVAKVISEL